MSSSFSTYVREDGIQVYRLGDFNRATIEAWERYTPDHFKPGSDIKSAREIYDLREAGIPSEWALEKLQPRPSTAARDVNIRTAILITDTVRKALAEVIALTLSIEHSGRAWKVFSDKDEAVAWLNE